MLRTIQKPLCGNPFHAQWLFLLSYAFASYLYFTSPLFVSAFDKWSQMMKVISTDTNDQHYSNLSLPRLSRIHRPAHIHPACWRLSISASLCSYLRYFIRNESVIYYPPLHYPFIKWGWSRLPQTASPALTNPSGHAAQQDTLMCPYPNLPYLKPDALLKPCRLNSPVPTVCALVNWG